MANINPDKFQGARRFGSLQARHRPFHCLYEVEGYGQKFVSNADYQMQYSVETLERELAEKQTWHILQITFENTKKARKHYCLGYWKLYADGRLVAKGSAEYAKQCFEESSTAFLDICRKAVEEAKLPPLTEREFEVLCIARAVAAIEPPLNHNEMKKRKHRAY